MYKTFKILSKYHQFMYAIYLHIFNFIYEKILTRDKPIYKKDDQS